MLNMNLKQIIKTLNLLKNLFTILLINLLSNINYLSYFFGDIGMI